MSPYLLATLSSLALCAAMLALLEVGRRIGTRRLQQDPRGAGVGVGAINTAVFTLLGLMLGFAYADASNRMDDRRRQVVEETNDIGTAWLRIALLPEADQPALREAFRRYVDARIEMYRHPPDSTAFREPRARADAVQDEIWSLAAAACSQPEGEPARLLLLPALNAMIDITTTRVAMALMHPPVTVVAMLFVLALASALFAGIGMAAGKQQRWLHRVGFAALISATVYLIADIEYPRRGLVRIDTFDQLLVDLRQKMG